MHADYISSLKLNFESIHAVLGSCSLIVHLGPSTMHLDVPVVDRTIALPIFCILKGGMFLPIVLQTGFPPFLIFFQSYKECPLSYVDIIVSFFLQRLRVNQHPWRWANSNQLCVTE